MTKKQLTEHIKVRVEMLVNDCRTFIYAKTKMANDHELEEAEWPGGGNFLCTLGAFSILNLLSKINEVLDGGDINKKTDLDRIKSEFSTFKKKFPDHANLLKHLIVAGFAGNTAKSEKSCFIKLYKDTKTFINWGFSKKEDAGKFWDAFRNKLSHVALPANAVAAFSPHDIKNKNYLNIVSRESRSKSPIFGPNGINDRKEIIDALAVERLVENINKISEYIVAKVDKCSDQKTIDNISEIL